MSTDVDAFVGGFEGDVRARFEAVREVLHDAIPGAAEKIAYGVPTLTVGGKNVVHFAAYAKHLATYPVPDDEAFVADAAPHRAGKGTLRFPHDQPLPLELIRRQAELLAQARAAR